jgi:tRNA A-37 threonylcarbamoyl transferase component Bud32
MRARPPHPCGWRELIKDLAADEITAEDRVRAEKHLEACEDCRSLFRQRTAERFPAFAGYTIIAEVGRGGFGVVYKAFSHGKQRIEALKVLFGETELREAYFENEVRFAAKLRHPHIATLYEAQLSTPPLYYAMEYVEGVQFDAYCHKRKVSLEERIKIIQTVARAIQYAHREGVVHRDLKPQNILIDAESQPRIVDFGIAKRVVRPRPEVDEAGDANAQHEGAMGTYGYMAPEQIGGQEVDNRADIYSLGVLLFHIITGQPARFATQAERLAQVLRERQVSRSNDLADIIACCVHPDPDRRYANCATLVDDLSRYLEGREILAHLHPTPAYRAARRAAVVLRHHPRPVQAVIAVAMSAVLCITYALCGARWSPEPGRPGEHATLVAFTPSTLAAMTQGKIAANTEGFDPQNKKSWRPLYGQLLQKIGQSAPRTVVFDYYFPDAQPKYDPAFVEGIQAANAPVVIGSGREDINGEAVLAPDIEAAAHAWGTLYSKVPDAISGEVIIPMAIRRGFNPPQPSLALAGFAAARFPDCTLDLQLEGTMLELRYRKRTVVARQSRWMPETDRIPVFDITEAGPADRALLPGDKLIRGRFPLRQLDYWREHVIPFEAVFAANDEQLREWFDGKSVLVGQMLPPFDQHALQSGESVFGCQVQALILDAMLAGALVHRYQRSQLLLWVCLWCAVVVALANAVPLRESWTPRIVAPIVALFALAGVLLAANVAHNITTPGVLEAAIGLTALLAVGGPILLVRLLHERQLRLAPGGTWSLAGISSSTTALACDPASGSGEA